MYIIWWTGEPSEELSNSGQPHPSCIPLKYVYGNAQDGYFTVNTRSAAACDVKDAAPDDCTGLSQDSRVATRDDTYKKNA